MRRRWSCPRPTCRCRRTRWVSGSATAPPRRRSTPARTRRSPCTSRPRAVVEPRTSTVGYAMRLPAAACGRRAACPMCGELFVPQTSQVQTCGKTCGGELRAAAASARRRCPTAAALAGLAQCQACRDDHGTVKALLRSWACSATSTSRRRTCAAPWRSEGAAGRPARHRRHRGAERRGAVRCHEPAAGRGRPGADRRAWATGCG